MTHGCVSFGILKYWNPKFRRDRLSFPLYIQIHVNQLLHGNVCARAVKINKVLLSSSYKSLHEHF